jgi:DNA-binding transcriptional MerR regulator
VSYDKPLKDTLLIGELAELTKISRDTLRHYERKGVLTRPARTAKGYRLYPANAVERVLLVRRALAVGFTLDELARIFSEREQGRAPCRDVHALVVSKLENVKERLTGMELLRDELETLVCDWDELLAENTGDEPAHLLETLAGSIEGASVNRTKQTPENFRRKGNKGNK